MKEQQNIQKAKKQREAAAEAYRLMSKVEKLSPITIHGELVSQIGGKIYQDLPVFQSRAEVEIGGERLDLTLNFVKTQTGYDMPTYGATWLHKMDIDHQVINGVDTKTLEAEMKAADWYHDIAETTQKYLEGYEQVVAIEASLNKISMHPDGGITAAALWNNHVPTNSVAKPYFIQYVEAEKYLYPTITVSADTSLEQALDKLKDIRYLWAENRQDLIDTGLAANKVAEQGVANSLVSSRAAGGDLTIIAEGHLEMVKELVQNGEQVGQQWVAFVKTPVIYADDLNFFKNGFQLAEYCYENTTDRDFCESMALNHFKGELDHWESIRSNPKKLLEVLETKMKQADWNYQQAETYDRFYEGETNVRQIEHLLKICGETTDLEKLQAMLEKVSPEAATHIKLFNTISMTSPKKEKEDYPLNASTEQSVEKINKTSSVHKIVQPVDRKQRRPRLGGN
jgi:hypothetical protein